MLLKIILFSDLFLLIVSKLVFFAELDLVKFCNYIEYLLNKSSGTASAGGTNTAGIASATSIGGTAPAGGTNTAGTGPGPGPAPGPPVNVSTGDVWIYDHIRERYVHKVQHDQQWSNQQFELYKTDMRNNATKIAPGDTLGVITHYNLNKSELDSLRLFLTTYSTDSAASRALNRTNTISAVQVNGPIRKLLRDHAASFDLH